MVEAWFSQPQCLGEGTAQRTLSGHKGWLFSHVPMAGVVPLGVGEGGAEGCGGSRGARGRAGKASWEREW